mgnify:CR=1 FL=1
MEERNETRLETRGRGGGGEPDSSQTDKKEGRKKGRRGAEGALFLWEDPMHKLKGLVQV